MERRNVWRVTPTLGAATIRDRLDQQDPTELFRQTIITAVTTTPRHRCHDQINHANSSQTRLRATDFFAMPPESVHTQLHETALTATRRSRPPRSVQSTSDVAPIVTSSVNGDKMVPGNSRSGRATEKLHYSLV
jgi:hypothetical protein